MAQLAGKVAIITGASSGIGRAAARLFAREGARVVLVARRAQALEALSDEIIAAGGEAVCLAGDVREEQTAAAAVALARERFGGLDIAFNNAGMLGDNAPTHLLSADNWRQVLDTNLSGAFLAARQQIPVMLARGGGALLFTSSFVGQTAGFPGMAAYAASKAGLIGLSQVIAAEYGAQGIRANALLPGGTDTEMGRSAAPTAEARSFVEGLHALKRLAEPEEIARAALFMLSDAASFITGEAIRADGGVSITRG
ncbi:SDR family oxidoreductase [Chromobacterium sp. IIBBL 290-4]|uniref:SDR family oxidoreductase n=1 Tax=Chromobacterium sp. IIBBL 290-4 TaxID=2953890 RepID=UPI0020B68953|nr:SDR family oxidoreductase [Chromobacterium sp. IIBBL 290-4]UTH75010.1 SDR family oxidoreductase [Chromobacterium sp. IIBBL 290-4]